MKVPEVHFVSGHRIVAPFPSGIELAMFGMGCFWGAEKQFWLCDGVYSTAVGYAAGHTPNPSYHEVCSGRTGHNEVVLVAYDPKQVRYEDLLRTFWKVTIPPKECVRGPMSARSIGRESTASLRRRNRRPTTHSTAYQTVLRSAGFGPITTEVLDAPEFYYAEAYHQQYLAKNPDGYCGHGGTGVACPIGIKRSSPG
jgi:peptide-methionine (S)-S-oxide reductase